MALIYLGGHVGPPSSAIGKIVLIKDIVVFFNHVPVAQDMKYTYVPDAQDRRYIYLLCIERGI